jgi:hypothetical protein
MAPFVTSEGSGQQVWSVEMIPDFACKNRSGYPLALNNGVLIHEGLTRLMLKI